MNAPHIQWHMLAHKGASPLMELGDTHVKQYIATVGVTTSGGSERSEGHGALYIDNLTVGSAGVGKHGEWHGKGHG